MSKLQQLIEAAKAAVQGTIPYSRAYQRFIALANPTTVLELCALLEKAEDALERTLRWIDDCADTSNQFVFAPVEAQADEALAAIKQWKEQT